MTAAGVARAAGDLAYPAGDSVHGGRLPGGVRRAIAQSAERVYGTRDETQRRLCGHLFVRLTALGEGTEDTRRRAPRAELLGGPEREAVSVVLDRLIAARLVTVDEESVTVAHEALIRGWPRLRAWLAEDRELLRAHRRLTQAAAEWEQHGREDGDLFQGTRLLAWDGRGLERFNDVERAFLDAGRSRRASQRRGRRRRVRVGVAMFAAAVAVVGALGGAALVQSDRTAVERDRAESRQLAAEARRALRTDPRGAWLLARGGRTRPRRPRRPKRYCGRPWPTTGPPRWCGDGTVGCSEWRSARTGAGWSAPARTARYGSGGGRTAASSGTRPHVLRGHRGEAWSPTFTPEGRRLATAGLDSTVRVWDLSGRQRPVVLRGHRGPVRKVVFSPDGRRLASAGDDGTVRVWDAAGRGKSQVLRGRQGGVLAVAFSADGRHMVTGGKDGTIRIWDRAPGRAARVLRGHKGEVLGLTVSRDGRRVARTARCGSGTSWGRTGRWY